VRRFSGQAVTATEIPRQLVATPNPADGPRQYAIKLKVAKKFTQDSLSRRRYYLQNGFTDDSYREVMKSSPSPQYLEANGIVPLGKWDAFVDQKGEEIEAQIRAQNPEADDIQVQSMTVKELKRLFGS